MKSKKLTLNALVTAALIGLGPTAVAQGQSSETFIPLERLSPQQRSAYQSQLQQLMRRSDIDWEKYVLGINERGELVLRERSAVPNLPVAQPSCWVPEP